MAQHTADKVVETVRSALAAEPRLDSEAGSVAMAFRDGTLILEGEVGTVAGKRLALEHAAAHPAVTGIVDRLRVKPAQRMEDAEILSHLGDTLLQEPAFAGFAVRQRAGNGNGAAQNADGGERGCIEIAVEGGVVTLNGRVPGLDDKRLAGVLAWWVPGSRDVVNGIAVDPPEEDGDEKIADAVRLVLEKDPFLDASQVRIGVRDATVTLTGLLRTEAEREMAEADAWYVFAVDKVVNRIGVET